MGFGLLAIGFIFFINPNINIFDVLPDFIGLWIICIGLRKLSVLNEDIKNARKNFFILSLVEVAKMMSIAFISSRDTTRYLLLAFVFGAAEVLLFAVSLRSLFIGIDHLGIMNSSKAVLATYNKSKNISNKKDVSTKIKKTILVFFVLRTVLSVLPELSELQLYDSFGYVGGRYLNYTEFKVLFYLFAVVFLIPFAVVYAIRVIGFFRSVAKDKDFTSALSASYRKFLDTNKNYYTASRMRAVMPTFTAAVFLCINPSPNGMISVPLILPSLFIAIASILIISRNRKAYISLFSSVMLAALSILYMFKKHSFYSEISNIQDIFFFEEAKASYISISFIYILQYIMLLLSVTVITFLMFGIFKQDAASFSQISSEKSERVNCESSVSLDEITVKKRQRLIFITMTVSIVIYLLIPLIFYKTGYESSLISDPESSFGLFGRIYSWTIILSVGLNIAWGISIISFFSLIKRTVYDIIYGWGTNRENGNAAL
ncbi:MAG: hypothetical protein HFE30_00410 [Clostridiales bacterium]|nr:hypothetical protein [Clostridiales bacterium]